MDAARAAAILGVALDADRAAITAAFARAARRVHPDTGGDGAGFADLVAARDVLLARARFRDGDAAPPPDAPTTGAMPVDPALLLRHPDYTGPRPQGRGLLATWTGLLLLAAFLGTYNAASPLGAFEPAVRWALLIASALGFAATGRRPFIAGAGVLFALGLVITVVGGGTWGMLVAQLVAIAPLYGLSLAGIARARFGPRRRVRRRYEPR